MNELLILLLTWSLVGYIVFGQWVDSCGFERELQRGRFWPTTIIALLCGPAVIIICLIGAAIVFLKKDE